MPTGREGIGIAVRDAIPVEAFHRSPVFGEVDESGPESCRARSDVGDIARQEGFGIYARVEFPTEVRW
jgi:hypothetical protein